MATKTLVRTFDDVHEAEEAVQALYEAGLARDDLGWICRTGLGEGLGEQRGGGLAGLLIGLSAAVLPGVGPVVVAGPLVSALTRATVPGAPSLGAASGLIGALVNVGVPSDEAHRYSRRLRAGAAIVTVTVDDDDEERRALAIVRGEAVQHGRTVAWRVSEPSGPGTRPSRADPR